MAALSIPLSEDELSKLRTRAAAHGFKDVRAYALSLLMEDISVSGGGEEKDYVAPDHLRIRSRKDLEAKLIQGLNSGPAAEMTSQDWDDIRREVRERVAASRQPRCNAS